MSAALQCQHQRVQELEVLQTPGLSFGIINSALTSPRTSRFPCLVAVSLLPRIGTLTSCARALLSLPRTHDSSSRVVCSVIGNFGTVFVDQSYWQSAIAAKPGSAHKGYLLGGLVWFVIPFALATALGLAGNALNVGITADDANNGLVPPAAAIALLGPSGGTAIIVMLTMAIVRKPATHPPTP